MKNKVSISAKITFYILIVFAVIFGAISVFIYFAVHTMVLHEVENQLRSVYSRINELNPLNTATLENMELGHNLEVAVFTPEGNKFFSNLPWEGVQLSKSPGIREMRISSGTEEKEGPDHFLIFRTSLQFETTEHILQISKDLEDEDRFFLILKELLIIANLLGLSLAAFTGYRISTRILKPVDLITTRANAISAEDLSHRIPPSETDDEISRLINSFNNMLERLENSFKRQQRFVSDASHELRTPLSVIQGYAGMLQRWAGENPELLDESLTAIRSETNRMRNLIERLLFLAKSDAGEIIPDIEHFNLTGLLRETAGDYLRHEKPERIRLKTPENLPMNSDPELIRQVVRILIDNSIKYSPEGSDIILTAFRSETDNSCTISVTDNGSGIDTEHFPYLFDRFFRADSARNRNNGGAGLGLAIAKDICTSLGASISVRSNRGNGSEFSIIFPSNFS